MDPGIGIKNYDSRIELSPEERNSLVKLGIFKKLKKQVEHITLQPCWLNNIKEGINTELTRKFGRWNEKLKGYLVGYEKPKLKSEHGILNEDHNWIHIDISSTFYIYQPEVGQRLKGTIKKIGNAAAICELFNAFSVTVFAADEFELKGWFLEQEIEFCIYSFIPRRRGPILRARSGECARYYEEEMGESTDVIEEKSASYGNKRKTFDEDDEEQPRKRIKKEKKKTEDSCEDEEQPSKRIKKEKKKTEDSCEDEELPRIKIKKEKKKKKKREEDNVE